MTISQYEITDNDYDQKEISTLPDRPGSTGYTSQMLKDRFDACVKLIVHPKFNALIEALLATTGASEIGVDATNVVPSTNIQQALEGLKSLADTKSDNATVANLYKSIAYNMATGVMTFTKQNGTTESFDLGLSRVAVPMRFDNETQTLYIRVDGQGEEQAIDLKGFVSETDIVDSTTIELSFVTDESDPGNKKIKADLKLGSVGLNHLTSAARGTIEQAQTYALQAQSSATSAGTSATNSAASASQASASATSASTSASNALTYKNAAETAKTALETAITQNPGSIVVDSTLSIAGAAADAQATGVIKEDLNKDDVFLFSGQKNIPASSLGFRNVGIDNNGVIIETSNPKELVSNMIDCRITNSLALLDLTTLTGLNYIWIYYYDANGLLASAKMWALSATPYAFPATNDFIRIRLVFNANTLPDVLSNIMLAMFQENVNVKYKTGKNKFNKNDVDCVNGYINSSSGGITTSPTYKVSGFIPIKAGETVTISPRVRHFLGYDNHAWPIPSTYVGSAQNNYTYTAAQDGYVRFSYYANQESVTQVENGTSVTAYEPYKLVLDGVHCEDDNTDYKIGNVLYGKKWAVCGDSFTYGGMTSSEITESDYIKEGPYAGQLRLYKWLIANRNNMTIQDLSLGGRTIAYPADGTFTNAFSRNGIYNSIDADADYITLYFGINDSHHRPSSTGTDGEDTTGVIPLGTINDSTPDTFYGAWNFVIDYLLSTHPLAHIGIIVSNGCETVDYPNATIEIAKKWGIPYIDLNGDDRTPMMNRSTNPNASARAKSLRNSAFRVSATNGHPNSNAHDYESLFIENFLRSI